MFVCIISHAHFFGKNVGKLARITYNIMAQSVTLGRSSFYIQMRSNMADGIKNVISVVENSIYKYVCVMWVLT